LRFVSVVKLGFSRCMHFQVVGCWMEAAEEVPPGFQVATGVPRFALIPSLWVFLIPLPYRVSVTTTVFRALFTLKGGCIPFLNVILNNMYYLVR
jgi:hypothetical protein